MTAVYPKGSKISNYTARFFEILSSTYGPGLSIILKNMLQDLI